jgi:P4 family phage/plasmid primase-like protien
MKQREWIEEILKHRPEGFDPHVETHYKDKENLKYGKWETYQGQTQIDERSIFPNEIVIDIDAETTEKAREENRKVLTYLDTEGYDYIVAETGGTGFHIHLFFKYEGLKADEYRKYRIALFHYLKQKCKEEVDADTTLWDEQPVKFDISNSKGHLVRALGGRKASTGHRKTQVLSSQLDKKEIQDVEKVGYPNSLPWMIEISKTGTSKSQLSIGEIKDKVEEVEEKEKQQHDKEVDEEFDTKVEGVDDVRNVDASKVLKLIGKDFKTQTNFECPFHEDSNPSANIYRKDGVERLYCFSDTCAEDSPPKVWNAVDIMMEAGYSFKEALEELGDAFDIEVQIGYNPRDYFGQNVKDNYVVQPQKLADEIMEEYQFKNVIGGGFYVWKDDYWQEVNGDEHVIGTEVDKRLQNESAAKHRNNVRDMIKNKESIKVDKQEFEVPENMIPFKNGVYDLEKGELVEHKPEYNFDFQYEVEYSPDLDDNMVQEFIETLMPDSEDNQKKLREIAALSLAPWRINQKVPILYGQGSNGKNQFVKIIHKMLGSDSYHKTSARKLQQDKFEMASVVDKQMAFFDEFEDVSKPGQLKTLVGDKNQNVREMRKESYTVETSVYPVFAANELPNPSDESDGFYRRWEIIDFKQKFTPETGDGNPDRIPVKELEKKYMNQEALNAFATNLIEDLERLLEKNKLTGQQSTTETRREWKKKGNALYAFIDKYLAPGDLPEEDGDDKGDFIIKDELLEVINNYMEHHNNSKVQKHRVTKALDSHPDFRIWTNYRPTLEDGSRPRAYAGLKVDESRVHQVQRFFTFNAYVSPPLANSNELGKYLDVVDEIPGKAMMYLNRQDEDFVSLFEIVTALDLNEEDFQNIMDCDYIKTDFKDNEGYKVILFGLDKQKLKSDGVEVDIVGSQKSQEQKFIEEQVEDKDEDLYLDELLDEAKSEGLDAEKVEEAVDKLLSKGEIFEPSPGRINKL